MYNRERTKCSATGKTRFLTMGDAKAAITSFKSMPRFYQDGKRVNRRMGKVRQSRYYWCVYCNSYHLTSRHKKTLDGYKKEVKPILDKRNAFVVDAQTAIDWKKDSLPFPDIKKKDHDL